MNKKIAGILSSIGIVALIIAPLSLLYIDTTLLFPFITGKNFLWRLFVIIAVVAWAGAAFFNTKFRISLKEPFFLLLTLFMALILLSNTAGIDPYLAFWSTAERMDGYIGLLHLYGYIIALVGLLVSSKQAKMIFGYLMIIAVILGLYGLAQVGEKGRIDSLLGNPIYLGSLGFFGVFFSTYYMVLQKKFFGLSNTVRIGFFALLALFFLFIIFQTGTRGALLGVVAGGLAASIAVLVSVRAPEFKLWRRFAGILVILILVSFGLFFGAREQLKEIPALKNNTLAARVLNISLQDTTTVHRIANWEMALEGVSERPLLGWGQESYPEVFSKFYDLERLYNAEQWFDRTHNTLLDWLLFGGVLGLLSYLSLFGAILWILWKKTSLTNLEKSVLIGLFIGYLFQNLVAFDSLVSGIFLYSSFAFVLLMSRKDPGDHYPQKYTGLYLGAFIVLVIAAGYWINKSIFEPRSAARNFIIYISVLQQIPDPEQVVAQLPRAKNIFADDTFFSQELALQMLQRRTSFIKEGVPAETQTEYLQLLQTEVNKALERHNDPTKTNYIYGVYLAELGAYDDAETALTAAYENSPDKATINWSLARVYESQGRTEEAEELLRGIVDRVPQYPQAEIILNQFLARTGTAQ